VAPGQPIYQIGGQLKAPIHAIEEQPTEEVNRVSSSQAGPHAGVSGQWGEQPANLNLKIIAFGFP
jgi:hypothetical protein